MHQKRKVYRMNLFLCVLLTVVILPVFITALFGRLKMEEQLMGQSEGNLLEVETNLPQIVAKQISMNLPDEVIKAQSIIARTQIMAAREKEEEWPSGFSVQELKDLWGEEYEGYYQRLEMLIEETKGKTLQYNGNYIYGAFHQVSAGNTRAMTEYYEKSEMPYLT